MGNACVARSWRPLCFVRSCASYPVRQCVVIDTGILVMVLGVEVSEKEDEYDDDYIAVDVCSFLHVCRFS